MEHLYSNALLSEMLEMDSLPPAAAIKRMPFFAQKDIDLMKAPALLNGNDTSARVYRRNHE
jgi:hypothetical protein